VMGLQLMSRDGCDWVRVFEALSCKIKIEYFCSKDCNGRRAHCNLLQ